MLRGFQGQLDFDVQDYKDGAGQRTNYLALSGQFTDYQDSVRLQAFVCKYANRLSYGDVAELSADMTGFGLMSRGHACDLVAYSAQKVVLWEKAQQDGQQLSIPFFGSRGHLRQHTGPVVAFGRCHRGKKAKTAASG